IITFIIVRSLNKSMDLVFSRYFEHDWANQRSEKNLKPLLSLLKFILWIVGIIFLMGNLGLDVSTAIAGLGVGGIAVAIAAQGILGDLFSYLVIFFDKPFELGDFIVFGDKSGVVERIGIKSIRIRVLSGELLIIANSDLTSTRIHNYKQMVRRRVVFTIGVIYETTAEKLEKIPSIIKDIITTVEAIEGVVFDRSHFFAFGDYSLKFETVYYVPTNDYNIYMNTQQEIYYKLFKAFENEGITFAYPTQMVYTKKEATTTEVVPAKATAEVDV
ncbi:MAG: mechanosensitive ion channel family protein, partial [Spirochaetia bacterium]|nr:mechanosensitive ion channel family protein [Spirochaetia bacterium]